MTALRLGSLCTGYGGLDLAADAVLGPLEHAWHAENDPHASRVLAHHWPHVPNLGDLTTVDWTRAEPVDVLTAGFPCQDVSSAGRRAGLKPGTRTGIWSHIAYVIATMRPPLVLLENVEGLLSGPAHSDVERCPWCLGDTPPDLVVRALGAVLADLAACGFDAEWTTVPASAVGAPHRRKRVFIAAWPTDTPRPRLEARRQRRPGTGTATDPACLGHRHPRPEGIRGIPAAAVAGFAESGRDSMMLLPTPRAAVFGSDEDVRTWLSRNARLAGARPKGSSGMPLGVALQVLPTADQWGKYTPAIRRWEHILGRPAPAPTEPGAAGQPRLAAAFVEWLMGLPAGWVTDHLTRRPALRCLGAGVVPQQGAHAYTDLFTV